MKCPKCDWTSLQGLQKFCPECGTKTVRFSASSDLVVICDGKLYDGTTCAASLTSSQKFCSSCGQKVDPQLFQSQNETCTQCGITLDPSCAFCPECGTKKVKLQKTDQDQIITKLSQTISNQPCQQPAPLKPVGVPGTVKDMESLNLDDSNKDTSGGDNVTQLAETSGNPAMHEPSEIADIPESSAAPTDDQKPSINENVDATTDNLPIVATPENVYQTVQVEKEQEIEINKDTASPDSGQVKTITEYDTNSTDLKTRSGNLSIVPVHETSQNCKLRIESVSSTKEAMDTSIRNDGGNTVQQPEEDNADDETNKKFDCEQKRKLNIILTDSMPSSEANIQNNNEVPDNSTNASETSDINSNLDEEQKKLEVMSLESQDSEADSDSEDDDNKSTGSKEADENKTGSGKGKRKRHHHNKKKGRKQEMREAEFKKKKLMRQGSGESPTPTPQVEKSKEKINNVNKATGDSVTTAPETNPAQVKNSLTNNGANADKPATTTQERVFGAWSKPEDSYVIVTPPSSLFSTTNSFSQTVVKDSRETSKMSEKATDDARGPTHGKGDGNSISNIDTLDTNLDTGVTTRSQVAALTTKNTKDQQNTGTKASVVKTGNKGDASKIKPQTANEKFTTVHFHVLVSKEFKFDHKNHSLVIVMENTRLGGWGNFNKILKFKRNYSEKFVEMTYEMMIPTSLMTTSRIAYKYCILTPAQKKEFEWEYYIVKDKKGVGANRSLTIPDKWRKLDVWHQYDGFVEKEQAGFKDMLYGLLTTWRKDLIKHAKIAVEAFCPTFNMSGQNNLSPDEILDQLEILMSCLKRVYLIDGKCWDSKEQDFKKEIGSCLVSTMLDSVKTEETGQNKVESEEQLERRITWALAAVYILDVGNIELDKKKRQTLCKMLIIRPSDQKLECRELNIANKYFAKRRKELLNALVDLAKTIANKTKDPSWLFIMPWIHFLSDLCKPFETPGYDMSHDDFVPKWWGISKFTDAVTYFKGKSERWYIKLEDVLDELYPLFEMDYFLPRTFMTAIETKDLKEVIETRKIPFEVCLATVISHLRKERPTSNYDYISRNYYFNHASITEGKVQDCIEVLHDMVQSKTVSEKDSPVVWKMVYKMAYQMFEESTSTDRSRTFNLSALILVNSLSKYCQLTNSDKDKASDILPTVNISTTKAVQWMDIYCWNWNLYMETIMQIWNNVVSPEHIRPEIVRDNWNKNILDALSYRLKTHVCTDTYRMTSFVQHYCQKVDHYSSCMQECLSKAAFEAIAKGYSVDYRKFTESENRHFGDLLSRLFISEWNKHIKKKSSDEEVLQYVVQWAPLVQYLKIYYKDQEKINLLSEDCVTSLVKAVSAIQSTLRDLLDGSLTIGCLKVISTPHSRFPELAMLVKLENTHTAEFVSRAIKVRLQEVEAFQKQSVYVTTLTSLCQHLTNVDRTEVDVTLGKLGDINKHKVNEFCKPADVSKIQDIKNFRSQLCAFRLSLHVLKMLPEMHGCYKSSTFLKMWTSLCNKQTESCTTLEDVAVHIWQPVKARWDEYGQLLQTGRITFQDMERMIGRVYKEEYEQIRDELKNFKLGDKVINERIEQLKKYRQLEDSVKGAKVILKFAQDFQLTGDFDQIRVIASHGQNDLEMRSFDNSLMKTCTFLKDLTRERAKCLYTFVKCQPLIIWLRESMEKAGLKELKVFVDLAFMSAGDEPINIARVQCLHSAVTGYAPLIFDLEQTAGYKKLLEKCDIVWRELEANPKLPDTLIGTNEQLEWLKEIKKAHGSVEVTSLFQADAINEHGIYTIGKQTNANPKELLHISNILRLTVPEDLEGKRKLFNYTFDKLQDLQSRLMLVAGKAEQGNDGVERFTDIFSSVIRLSNEYIKLTSAGCVLFKDWTARFLCDPGRPVCASLQFGIGAEAPTLKGRRTERERLQDIIPKLANFMEKCYEQWLDYIRDKRKTYKHLNYFTVDQLVILQQELVKLGTDREPSHLIYPLLSAVKDDCLPGDLLDAMTLAQQELTKDEEMTEATVDAAEMEEVHADSMQTFIQELINAGYDEVLAVKAAEHHTPDQVTEGIIWCMNHEEEIGSEMDTDLTNHSTDDQRREDQVPRHAFSGWSHSDRSIQSVITSNIASLSGTKGGVGVEPLIRDLTTLWQEFLGSITSNIKDYLSLEHLGLILRHLAQKSRSSIERSLPPGFVKGCPNLIICPSEDVLSVLLTLYMLQKDQPLPQSDEVLICTANTTIDEVDIFWRRAIFDGCSKIHCLVNADLLNFDVSEKAEKCLEVYMQETNYAEIQYQLVVICGSNNEYRSQIVSSLDKHRRPPLLFQQRHLQDYLATKLRVEQQRLGKVRPASTVDLNNSSVRLIKSWRSGVGKTLYMKRRENDLDRVNKGHCGCDRVSIPLQERNINLHYVIERLLEHTAQPDQTVARIFHIDVAHEVQEGVDYLLFNLLVLGCLMDKTGYVWRKSCSDLYLIETMPLMVQGGRHRGGNDLEYVHQMLSLLPDMTCRSPIESSQIYNRNPPIDFMQHDQMFDQKLFEEPVYQRPFQYLFRLDNRAQLETVNPFAVEGEPKICLQTLLGHCGMQDPSWAELHHFVWFLNTQLCAFENSGFIGPVAAECLPGFSTFVLRFLIQMSRDFSTRSLDMSEESPGVRYEPQTAMEMDHEPDQEGDQDGEQGADLQRYQMRRTWESSPHPYLFFNADRDSFTFLGFNIDRGTGNVIDLQTRQVIITAVMNNILFDALVDHRVPMNENFDNLPRHEKIEKLCKVIGQDMPHDPDDTYELTTDNVKKILAIYMRFRCDIPVIIMGETGCGKTTLIKFMCALQAPPGVDVKNMILMKVHGGTTNQDIIKKVREAEKVAAENVANHGPNMYTVLFFDEANTTEAIGLIKEIMCDKSMEGRERKFCENLKMVAACNPYRKHSKELIEKLEQAGLGYHVDADETTDKLGRVPMRRLVYRVQPLPQSLLPLVWDFGQLNTQVEDLYIRQMVKRFIREDNLPDIGGFIEVVSAILTASQDYMRLQKNECSFVSLRDVDRVLSVMSWFYERSQGDRTLYNKMDTVLYQDIDDDEMENDEEEEDDDDDEGPVYRVQRLDDVTRSLVLALGVCYHACLKTRDQYREHIEPFFRAPCRLFGGADQIEREITCCQDVFLANVQLENNIARNMALKENLFMMVVCIELRIPLFLVGKPGSSKSLAKTIVSDAMQGNAAREALFKELKQAQMVSFQCSPLSTPDGILGTFRQCAQFQKDKDLNSFVSIVVLDEVGLAEDSPRMPLKTLHPLLEDGCQGDEDPQPYMKVAFIGISNWALDPAKMNRGILVQREVPDLEELQNSARGICSDKRELEDWIEPLIEPLSVSYLEIFKLATQLKREFFGLRDFYSLIKMIYLFADKSHKKPTWCQILHAIKRNFGGLDHIDPVDSFRQNLAKYVDIEAKPIRGDPDCTASGLIRACLFDINQTQSESRYLLLLTENYGALTILQQQILDQQTTIRPITIFGSSFRSDLEYTQVCRNINKIKVCMETGNTVVLLNLENLYESLYDALNQYYVYFGGERYVDLGLGTHRVKCPVHRDFRLIVVAEKQKVYDKFPIPLINRLEKHFLTINTMLSRQQLGVVKQLENWAQQFAEQKNMNRMNRLPSNKVGDVFMGYHADTCSAIVLHVWPKDVTDELVDIEQVLQEAKAILLWCATPDAVARLERGNLPLQERKTMNRIYNYDQQHDSIFEYLHFKLVTENTKQLFSQVTTHSKLLAGFHTTEISKATGISQNHILLLQTLSSFDTEQQFSNRIQHHLQNTDKDPSLLIIQCDSGDINANLVACARYCVRDEYQKVSQELRAPVHVVFIVQLPRIAGGCFTGFQCGVWHSVHIDDLCTTDIDMPSIQEMQDKPVSQLVSDAVHVPMDTEVDMETENINGNQSEPMEYEQSESALPSNQRPNVAGTDQNPQPSTSSEGQISDSSCLQMEDIIVNFEEAGRSRLPMSHDPKIQGHVGTSYHGNKLNVNALILACVHSALSMVKDKEDKSSHVTERTTSRVSLILELFHRKKSDAGDQPFLEGISRIIADLLREKEKDNFMAKQWLVNEAAKQESIQKAGTFRRACQQTLESKISPILAGIIGHLDTNQNLDLLQGQSSWKQDMWLSVLNASGALQLKYSDLKSPTRQSDLQEVIVMTTGCEGHMFHGQMPFSWLLYNLIVDILKNPADINTDGEEMTLTQKVDLYVGLLGETPLGHILHGMQEYSVIEEMIKDYLQDFVHTVYHAGSEEEQQLVMQSIHYVTSRMSQDQQEAGSNPSLLHRLIFIHQAYQILAPRLTYFRTMNNVWTECSKRIVAVKTQNPDHFMFQEQEFTFSALCLLLENLAPVKNDLDNVAGRSIWLTMVHQYRPVIEKVISLHAEDPEIYGAHGFRSVQRARCLWSRVVVMKLFLEHVCSSNNKEAITIKHCMPLWKLLGDETNLKEEKSMKAVEMFLKSCNTKAMKEFMGKEEHCCHCEAKLEGPPIVLPCKDLVCDGCYHDLVALGDRLCPNQACSKQVPPDWNPERQTEKKNERAQLKEYQKRCNTFFMDIVSQLCFTDNTPPTDEVINKLLGYITCTTHTKRLHVTKELTIFDSGIDPNPVFRSFLLQLLLRTIREDKLKMNLGRYLEQAETLLHQNLGTEGGQQYIELCQLVIQCLEDMFIQEVNKSTCDEVTSATNWLRHARLVIDDDEELTVEKLYGLAETRMGLAVTARCIAETVEQNDGRGTVGLDRGVRKLIEAAHDVCLGSNLKWPKTYLIKFICRRYGIDTYQTASKSQQQFIRLLGMADQTQQQVVEVCDRFVVCGDIYTQIREALTKVMLGEDPQQFIETIQGMRVAGGHVETMVQLALYREVTCSNLYPQDKRKVSKEVLNVISQLLQDSDVMGNKNLLQALLSNNLGNTCNHLMIHEGEDMRNQGIQCLLLHFLSVMTQLQGDRTLMQPLLALMSAPQTCGNMYLPTMPQDDLEDVKEALLAARNTPAGAGENPVFYRCPNGHPYVIGNCGRPASVGTCKDCGATIGGEGYQLRPGNIQDQGRGDATVTGHILGRAQIRGQGHTTERSLTPVYCGYVRLITHMAMYLGANHHAQGIQNMIKPDLELTAVAEFLWQHIVADLNDLQRGQGRSGDDIILLAHSIITKIMNTHNQGDHVEPEACGLTSKKGRQQWEELFSNKYLQPILHTMEQTLKTNNQLIMQDKRLGSDPLLCLLYEVEGAGEQHNPGSLQNIPAVWRFRTPISLNHLRQEFETQTVASGRKKKKPHRVLQLFLEEEHNLRAIRYIPSILRLHRALIHKYQRKLDKAEASIIVVEQLRKEEILGPDTNSVLQDFIDAWELVRKTLETYLCPTEVGGMFVAKDYCRPITDKTPISHLLPTTKEAGLCSYALLDYLTRKQNDFLDKYMQESKRNANSISVVSPRELTSAHLISYDPTHDILPLVLANCQYSFEIGKGNRIEYDFTSLERQLMDRFLFSKSRIDVGRVLEVDQMVYRAEFTNAAVFQKLAEKIPQEDLNAAVKSQICGDFRSLPDLCESLDHLDITISFLKSIGGQPDQGLETFMTSKLKMTTTMHSDKAKQVCEFRHAQSLWMLLSLEKSKRMDEQGQPIESIFESVTQEFHVEPEKDAEIKLDDYMKVLSVDKLSQLVAVMHEYIVLKVAVRENREDEDYTDTSDQKLHQWLCGYVEGLDMALQDLLPVLNNFPKDLLHKHSVHTWILMYRKLKLKQTGSRRY